MNSLNRDLTNVVVVLRENRVTGTNSQITSRIFECQRGRGCDPLSKGTSVMGQFLGNSILSSVVVTIDASDDIERLATEREAALART